MLDWESRNITNGQRTAALVTDARGQDNPWLQEAFGVQRSIQRSAGELRPFVARDRPGVCLFPGDAAANARNQRIGESPVSTSAG